MLKKTVTLFNYRPLTIIGLIIAIHSIAYGLGYIIPTSGFEASVLYNAFEAFIKPAWVGAFLTAIGFYSAYAWVKDSEKHISNSSFIMAFFWLFAAMTYFVAGAFGQGIGIGLVWSLLSGYTAFAYKNKEETVLKQMNQHFKDILDGKEKD